tara:strand:+ start:722 stop:1057 length:336 start_codon:yes stop_codon:yes gene_type:complete
MKKNNKFSRSKPTIHNQNKPFNKKKFGPTWDHIRFELQQGEVVVPEGANQALIATLYLGKCGHIDLTYTELSRIIETCQDAQYAARIAQRLGMTEGSPMSTNKGLQKRRMV